MLLLLGMKLLFKVRNLILWASAMLLAGLGAEAQQFGLSVTSSSSSVLVSNSLTYTISVTNLSLISPLPDATVTNILPASVQIVSATPYLGDAVSNFNGTVVFYLRSFLSGVAGAEQMTLSVRPTTTGAFTNMVTVFSPSLTGAVSTNAVVTATNVPPTLADIGVAIASPTQSVITNDLTGYGLSVTNYGPATATGVVLTNVLPAGAILKGANHAYTRSGTNLIFNLGTLANGGHTNVQVSIQPTNVAVLVLTASVGASGTEDTNTVNNFATNSITVIGYPPANLVATVVSPQIFNAPNGFFEQTIAVSNAGPESVTAARVVVTGLLTNELANASGTNNNNPYVVYAQALPAGQSVRLLLQFYAFDYFAFSNSQMQAFAVPVPDLTPPAMVSTSTNLIITKIRQLSSGKVAIEFPSVAGRTYTVVYSDNVLFSNAMIAPPSITAGGNLKQWVDYGPPTTISVPTNAPARFYRVIQNP